MAHDDKVPLTQSHAKIHSNIAINLPDNIEMGGKIDSIRVCVAPLWKTVLRYLSYVCTAFIMYLLNLWIPSLHVAMTFVDSDIEKATWVIVHGADNNIEIVPLIQQSTFTKTIKVFTYRLFKYYYDETAHAFQPCQFNINQLTFNQINQEYRKGLDEISVNNNEIFYGKNLTNIPPVTVWQLLVKEILSPLYIFQVYSFIVWTLDDYTAYAVVILLFSAISISITLYDTMKTRNKLQKMSYYETPVKVFRRVHGKIVESTVSSAELLPGDLIEIPERVLMPCDVVLLTGTCVMNEAMLTGESIPVVKNAIPNTDNCYNPQEDKQYTLYSGTECIQTRHHQGDAILGVVTLTGFTTVKGDLIRTMLFPKPTDFKFYSDSFKFIGIMAFMAVVGLLIDLSAWIRLMQEGVDLSNKVVIKALQIITVAVPPALPTCMQIGITIALSRLSEKHIYCIAQSKINEAGRINVMCFDKTGTLTEEGLDLLGVRPVIFNKKDKEIGFYKLVHQIPRLTPKVVRTVKEIELSEYESEKDKKESFFQKAFMFPSEALMEIMATCHSLTIVRGNMIGDPLDLKMFQATNWDLQDNPQKVHEILMLSICTPPTEVIGSPTKPRESFVHKDGIGIVQRYEFSSRMQRMSVVVKGLSDVGFRAHVKGSPEKIRELCRPETVPANFHNILRMYTEEGYRVLACGSKIVNMNARQIKAAKREDIENDLTFVGLIVMENRLKPITTRIIDQLQTANIKTVMVTGDNALTAISVARQCHIVGPQQRVYLGDVAEKKVDGKEVILWKDFEQSENRLNEDLEPDVEYGEEIGSTTFRRRYVKSYFDKSLDSESFGEGLNEEDKREFLSLHPSEAGTFNIMEHDEEKGALLRRKSSFGASHFDILVHQDSCLAVTGRAFSLILKEANENSDPRHKLVFEKMLQRCLIFARMHPDEKALMIKHLKTNQRKTVGMCGDGANDVGALKTANAGVSLSEAEASIAAPFTSNIQDISCIATLLREGKSALAISFQTFKYMALYSIIQCTSVTILYYNVVDFTNEHYYYFDIFIILILSFTMGFSETTNHLAEERPIGSLISFPVLSSVIGQTIIQIVFQLFTFGLLTKQTWFTAWTLLFDERAPNYENTSLFCVSSFQYVFVSLAFIAGRPFRKPFYTNFWYSLAMVFFVVLNLLFLFNPFEWTSFYEANQFNMIYPLPVEWKDLLLLIIIVNCAATMAWETILVPIISNAWKERKRKNKSRQSVKN